MVLKPPGVTSEGSQTHGCLCREAGVRWTPLTEQSSAHSSVQRGAEGLSVSAPQGDSLSWEAERHLLVLARLSQLLVNTCTWARGRLCHVPRGWGTGVLAVAVSILPGLHPLLVHSGLLCSPQAPEHLCTHMCIHAHMLMYTKIKNYLLPNLHICSAYSHWVQKGL